LPVLDLLFGTFENPEDFAENTGYYDGASAKLGEMLRFRDVTRPNAVSLRLRLPLTADRAPQ
jgi:hypothetical protein